MMNDSVEESQLNSLFDCHVCKREAMSRVDVSTGYSFNWPSLDLLSYRRPLVDNLGITRQTEHMLIAPIFILKYIEELLTFP